MKFQLKCVSSVAVVVAITCLQVIHAASNQTNIWPDYEEIYSSGVGYDYDDDDADTQKSVEESRDHWSLGTNQCLRNVLEQGCICEVSPTASLTCNRMDIKTIMEHTDFEVTLNWMNVTPSTKLNLDFNENCIEYLPTFPNMSVGVLSLSRHQISGIEPKAFSELKGLHTLDLSYNNLSCRRLTPEIFFGRWNYTVGYYPLELRHLNLAHNHLTCINKDVFDHLPNLKVLDLSQNPLKALSGSTGCAIRVLRNLESLNLANTGIDYIPDGIFRDMQRLEWYLRLDSNNIWEMDWRSFSGLGNLETLSLKHSYRLREIKYGTFARLQNLTLLDLSFCRKLEYISADSFLGMDQRENTTDWKLKEIRLNNNALPFISQSMCPWNMIDILDVSNNPFVCDCKVSWMLDSIIPVVERTSPEMVREIKCTIPATLITIPLVDITKAEINSRCEVGEFADGDYEGYFEESNFNSTFFTIIGVSVGLIVISTVVIIVIKRTTSISKDGIFSTITYTRMKTSKTCIPFRNEATTQT